MKDKRLFIFITAYIAILVITFLAAPFIWDIGRDPYTGYDAKISLRCGVLK